VSPLCLCLLLAAVAEQPGPLQKEADDAVWNWKDDNASLFTAFQRYQGDYQVTLVRTPNTFGKIFVRFGKDGRTIYEFEGHYASGFVGKGGQLYYTEYHPSASGCALVAVDLANGKCLWKTQLEGLGPIDHTKYRNLVILEMPRDGVLRILGNESAGQYVEYVDAGTGKTVGHKVFPRK
jgi:hypothetical protein